MKIKKYIKVISLAACTGLATTACNDFLDLEPMNEITLENYWTEKSDVESVVISCYNALEQSDCIARMSAWGEMRSDNITIGSQTSTDVYQLQKGNLLPSNAFASWTCFYTVINRCNTVLKYAPDVQSKDPNYKDSELAAHIAEVTALRGLCYFYLIRAFRDVPYITEPSVDDNQQYIVPVTKFDDILTQSIADLERVKDNAVRKYPEEVNNTARITRYAIYALLADMYLWKQDYDNCIRYCDLIIDYKKTQYKEEKAENTNTDLRLYSNIYPLIREQAANNMSGNAYNAIFGRNRATSTSQPESSFEGIFELYFSNTQDMKNGFVDTYYGNSTTTGQVCAVEDLYKDAYNNTNLVFKKTDCRYLESMQPLGSIYAITKYVNSSVSFNSSSASSSSGPIVTNSQWAAGQNGSNWIVYRLTDIMLMKAEAEVEKAGEANAATITPEQTKLWTSAFTLVGAVYKRANNLSEMSSDTLVYANYATTRKSMEELVLLERRRELLFEGKRWFDLVRLARRDGDNSRFLSYAVSKYSDNQSAMRKKLNSPDALYFPYSENELKVNTALTQNPAYQTDETITQN